MKIEVQFHKPVPYDVPLKCVGRITKETGLTFEGTGELYDMEGKLLDRAFATYFKLSLEKATQDGVDHSEEINVMVPDGLTEIQ